MQPQRKPQKEKPLLDEALLLDKWYAGDEKAFTQLYNHYFGQAIKFSLSLCRNREMSKDLTQKTFIRIHKKVTTNSGQRIRSFRSYLFAALTQNFFEQRRNSNDKEVELNLAKIIPLKGSSDDARINQFMDQDLLTYVLSQLNEQQKKVYVQQLEGYKVEEIAKMNELTLDQVRGLLYRARKKLKRSESFIRKIISGKEYRQSF